MVNTNEPVNDHILSEAEQLQYKAAASLLGAGDIQQAEAILNKLVTQKPGFVGCWVNLAIIQYNKNNLTEAKALATKAMELNSNSAQVYNLLGRIDTDLGNFIEAKNHFMQAIAIKDDYAIAHYNLALLYDIYFQQIDLAVGHYRRYLETNDNQDQFTVNWLQQLESSIRN